MPIARTKRKCVMKQNNKGQITNVKGLRLIHINWFGTWFSCFSSPSTRRHSFPENKSFHPFSPARLSRVAIKKTHLVLVLVIKQHFVYWWWGPVDTCEFLGRALNIHRWRLPVVGLKSYYLLQPKSRQNRIRFIRSIIKLQLELSKIANGLVFKKCSCTMKRILITVIAFNTATNWYSNLEV